MPNFAKLMTRKTIILLHKTFKFINDILNYKSILRKKNYRTHLKIKKQAYNINCDYIFNTELLQAEKNIDQKDKSRISISPAIRIASFKPHYMFL